MRVRMLVGVDEMNCVVLVAWRRNVERKIVAEVGEAAS